MKKEFLYFIIETIMAVAETAWDLQLWNAYSSASLLAGCRESSDGRYTVGTGPAQNLIKTDCLQRGRNERTECWLK